MERPSLAERPNIASSASLWTGWRPSATGDFNNDGQDDVVIHNLENDWFGILYMNGANIQSSQGIAGWQDWNVVGSGYFDSDNTQDLLVRHDSLGYYGVWYMGGDNGNQIVRSQGITPWDGWDIKATGDFDNDGKADLAIQHQTEDWFGILYLDENQQVVRSESVAGWADWNITGSSDLNNDGKADLLIQHDSQPWRGVWHMNGSQIISSQGLAAWAGWEVTA